jgi:hypothetical protein
MLAMAVLKLREFKQLKLMKIVDFVTPLLIATFNKE